MTKHTYEITPTDIYLIEREARRLRAEAMANGFRRLAAWITRKPLPRGRTA